jgi:hypothetical protein
MFKSKAQQRFMFSQHPQMAKEFAAKTPNMASLPAKVGEPTGLATAMMNQKNKGMLGK